MKDFALRMSDAEKQQLLDRKRLKMFDLYKYDIPVHDAVFYINHPLTFLLSGCSDTHAQWKRLNQNPYLTQLKTFLHTNLYPNGVYLGRTLHDLVEQEIQQRIKDLGVQRKSKYSDSIQSVVHPWYLR